MNCGGFTSEYTNIKTTVQKLLQRVKNQRVDFKLFSLSNFPKGDEIQVLLEFCAEKIFAVILDCISIRFWGDNMLRLFFRYYATEECDPFQNDELNSSVSS